jgi:succinate-semialdehyde dehydrogenase/glutarate-semialdehyde dehydrogenase
MAYQSINPNDGKLVRSFEHLSAGQLEVSLADAESCFHSWKLVSYAERAVILHRAAELMRTHVDDFAKLATLEMGKRISEARGEVANRVPAATEVCRWHPLHWNKGRKLTLITQ